MTETEQFLAALHSRHVTRSTEALGELVGLALNAKDARIRARATEFLARREGIAVTLLPPR